VVDSYFSRDHFDDRETCCPLIALPSDVMRGSDAAKGAYREVLEKLIDILLADLNEPHRREHALAIVALCVGGVVAGEVHGRSGAGRRVAAGRPIRPATNWNGDNLLGAYPQRQGSGIGPWIKMRIRNSRQGSN
jgi:hypothetical protein